MSVHLRVAIVDDKSEYRTTYRKILERHDDFTAAGEAANGRSAIQLFMESRPDVMLMDLNMPIMAGQDAIRQIILVHPSACIVAMTVLDTPEFIIPALAAGARGYILKSCSESQLTSAIHQAHQGQMPLSAPVRVFLADSIRTSLSPTQVDSSVALTSRERDLLQSLSMGITNQEIAQQLSLSTGTVKQYIRNIGKKLDARSRTHIVTEAIRRGILSMQTQHAKRK